MHKMRLVDKFAKLHDVIHGAGLQFGCFRDKLVDKSVLQVVENQQNEYCYLFCC